MARDAPGTSRTPLAARSAIRRCRRTGMLRSVVPSRLCLATAFTELALAM